MAVIVIINVVAPEPSKCPIIPIAAVAKNTNTILVPAFFLRTLITGSNTPTSFINEKNEIENTNNDTVETILEIPDAANLFTVNGSNPAIKAANVGKIINATGGITIFLIKQKIKTATIIKPINANFDGLATGALASFLAGAGFKRAVKSA